MGKREDYGFFGKIYGFIAVPGGLGGATGTWLSGKIFDLTASYKIAFLGVLAVFVLVVVFFWLTSPDTPEKLEDGTRRDHKLGS